MITGRYRGYLSRKSYWKQNTAASRSQQHAHITVVCLPFSARFSNRRLLWLNFITSYTVLTADVFSSVYSLVIFRLYPPLCAFPRTSCFSLPVGTLQWEASVGQKRWGNLRRVGGSSMECPQRGVHTWIGTKGKLVLGPWPECLGWEQFLEELLPGTHSLEDPWRQGRSELPLGQRAPPEAAQKGPGRGVESASPAYAPPSTNTWSCWKSPLSLPPTPSDTPGGCLPFASVPQDVFLFRVELGARPRTQWSQESLQQVARGRWRWGARQVSKTPRLPLLGLGAPSSGALTPSPENAKAVAQEPCV